MAEDLHIYRLYSWGRLEPIYPDEPCFAPGCSTEFRRSVYLHDRLEVWTVGRGRPRKPCDITIHETRRAASSLHAVICRMKTGSNKDKVYLRNGSAHSTTWVNGKQVGKDEAVVLNDLSEVWLGYIGGSESVGFRFLDLYTRRPFLKPHGYEVMLGSGGYGEVHKVHVKTCTPLKLAVKVLDFSRPYSRLTPALALSELVIVKELLNHNHPNIVRLMNIYTDTDSAFMYLYTMEYLPQGDLFTVLAGRGQQYAALCEMQIFMQQLLSALQFLHDVKGIIHRDVKLSNLLVKSRKPWFLVLSDFGAAKRHDMHEELTSFVGTRPYAAPEMALSRDGYGFESDNYSCGMVLFYLLQGNLGLSPYIFVEKPSTFEEHIRFCSLEWDRLHHRRLDDSLEGREVLAILRGLLHEQPASRLTLQAALQSRWLLRAPVIGEQDLQCERTQPGRVPSKTPLACSQGADSAWERAMEAAAYTSYDCHMSGERSYHFSPSPAVHGRPSKIIPRRMIKPALLEQNESPVTIPQAPKALPTPKARASPSVAKTPLTPVRRSPRLLLLATKKELPKVIIGDARGDVAKKDVAKKGRRGVDR